MNELVGKKRKLEQSGMCPTVIQPNLKKRKTEKYDSSYFVRVTSSGDENSFGAVLRRDGIFGSEEEREFIEATLEMIEKKSLEFEFGLEKHSKDLFVNHLKWNKEVKEKFKVDLMNSEDPESEAGRFLLSLEEHVAFVTIPETEFFLVVFFEAKKSKDDSGVSAFLCEKFSLVLDLDNTLIESRLSKDINDLGRSNEYLLEEFRRAFGVRIFTSVKDYCRELLPWCCKWFKIVICTNSVFPYALEITKLLDPLRNHMLKGVTQENLTDFLRTRKDLCDYEITKNGIRGTVKVKDLQSLNLTEHRTIIFDDQTDVWVRNQKNVLPFRRVIGGNGSILRRFKQSCWKKVTFLQLVQSSRSLELFEVPNLSSILTQESPDESPTGLPGQNSPVPKMAVEIMQRGHGAHRKALSDVEGIPGSVNRRTSLHVAPICVRPDLLEQMRQTIEQGKMNLKEEEKKLQKLQMSTNESVFNNAYFSEQIRV